MKKIFFLMLGLAAMLASCSKDEEPVPSDGFTPLYVECEQISENEYLLTTERDDTYLDNYVMMDMINTAHQHDTSVGKPQAYPSACNSSPFFLLTQNDARHYVLHIYDVPNNGYQSIFLRFHGLTNSTVYFFGIYYQGGKWVPDQIHIRPE